MFQKNLFTSTYLWIWTLYLRYNMRIVCFRIPGNYTADVNTDSDFAITAASRFRHKYLLFLSCSFIIFLILPVNTNLERWFSLSKHMKQANFFFKKKYRMLSITPKIRKKMRFLNCLRCHQKPNNLAHLVDSISG